jgi:hypothetical protein
MSGKERSRALAVVAAVALTLAALAGIEHPVAVAAAPLNATIAAPIAPAPLSRGAAPGGSTRAVEGRTSPAARRGPAGLEGGSGAAISSGGPAADPPLTPIVDPSFQGVICTGGNCTADPNWTEVSSGHFDTEDNNYNGLTGYTGLDGSPYTADLCGYPTCDPDEVYQTFTVPDNVSQATLTFDAAAVCPLPPDATCDTGPDYPLTVGLSDASGNEVDTAFTFSVTNPSTGYYISPMSPESVDAASLTAFLQAHPLQSVRVFADDVAAPGDYTEWFVDNIVLSVTALASAPTRVTATSAAPGDASLSWSAPADATVDGVTGYTVTEYNDQGTQVGTPQPVSGTSTTFTGLTDGTPWYWSVAAVNPVGMGTAAESNSVTPLSGAAPGAAMTAVSTDQYFLPNSDGSTWQVMDESSLAFTVTPSSGEDVLLGANCDLWTFTAGYNQDIGIQVTAGSGTPVLAAWKESGGFGGTFSPNAAFVETVYPMSAGTTYTVQVVWKTNKPAIGATIAAGAGPIGTAFSPTRLTADVLPSGYQSEVSTTQYTLSNSSGSSWTEIDAANLTATLSPSVSEDAVVSGNADLWTANAGYNQDLGIEVSVDGATPVLVAWKESGGFAGTFSPNAAFVQEVYPLTAGNTYVFSLWWKTNRAAPGATIYAGAGSSPTFSPTRITAYVLPANAAPEQWESVVSDEQYQLANSNGSTWTEMDASTLVTPSITIASAGAAETVLVSGNADLWTANATYNQDIGIFVSEDAGTPTLVAWKESGGFAGTFSPNAAFVQAVYTLEPGHNYVFSLWWKTNKPASGVIIYAGAGPIGTLYSPTRLTVVPQL